MRAWWSGIIMALALPAVAMAADEAEKPAARKNITVETPCTMVEQVNVSITVNFQVPSAREAKSMFYSRLHELDALVTQGNTGKWELQSINYSLNQSSDGAGADTYQVNGTASYTTDNSDQAFAVADRLPKQKMMSISVNVNATPVQTNAPCTPVVRKG
jgi:hypothetical protein